jgi:hypothetical protein
LPILPGEDPDAFRRRQEAWAEALAPGDVVEQFLIERAAVASWKIERADRVEADRAAAAARDAAAERRAARRDEAEDLGRLLLDGGDPDSEPDLARALLKILTPGAQAAPQTDSREALRSLLDRLEATAEGCAWLLGHWAELRAPLERGRDWEEGQLVAALRLSGRQPLDMRPEDWEDYTEGRCSEDDEEAELGGEEIDEDRLLALDAAIEAQIKAEDRRKLTRQLVGDVPGDEAGARAALLGVVERASGRLSELAAAHEARWEAEAAELAERTSFDIGPEEEQLWRYQFGCERSLRRTLDTLLKLRREGRGQGPRARGEEDRGAGTPSGRDEAVAQPSRPYTDPETVSDPGGRGSVRADPAVGLGRSLALPKTGRHQRPRVPDEAIAAVTAQPPVQDAAIAPAGARPSLQDEAISQVVAPPAPQNEAGTPAIDHPGLRDEAIAPVRCGSTDPAGATAGLPPGPVRAGDLRSARWRDPETSPQHLSPETGNDSRPDPQEAAESRVPRPREVVAPDDRLPTGSEPVAVEPVDDRDARAVTNEASGLVASPASASAGIGSSNPALRLTDGIPGPEADGPMTDTDARTVTNEASGPTEEGAVVTNEANPPTGEVPVATNEASGPAPTGGSASVGPGPVERAFGPIEDRPGLQADSPAGSRRTEAQPDDRARIATNEAIDPSGEARRGGADPVSWQLPRRDEPVLADRGSAGEIADRPPLTPDSCETPTGGLT